LLLIDILLDLRLPDQSEQDAVHLAVGVGVEAQAARLLRIARQTLRQKIRDLGLHITHSVEAEGDEPA
jgi:hypothetical protein